MNNPCSQCLVRSICRILPVSCEKLLSFLMKHEYRLGRQITIKEWFDSYEVRPGMKIKSLNKF